MANELYTQIITKLTNPTNSSTAALLKGVFEQGPFQLTQTTQAIFSDTVTVGTSEQDLAIPTGSKFTAALQGVFCAINLDDTNYVKIGPKDTTMTEFGRLYPLYPVQIPIAPSVVLRWVADTAACDVFFVWFAK